MRSAVVSRLCVSLDANYTQRMNHGFPHLLTCHYKDLHFQGLLFHLIPNTYYNWFPCKPCYLENFFSLARQMRKACIGWMIKGISCKILSFILKMVGCFSKLRGGIPGRSAGSWINMRHSLCAFSGMFVHRIWWEYDTNLNGCSIGVEFHLFCVRLQ